MMTGFVLSTKVANAQTSVASTVQISQAKGKKSSKTANNMSEQDTTQQKGDETAGASNDAESVTSTPSDSSDNSTLNQKDGSNASDTTNPANNVSEISETADQETEATVSSQVETSKDSIVTTASADSVSNTPTNNDDQSAIYNDDALKTKNIDVNKLTSNNVLKLASLFHIFANQASLSSDTRGNLAVGILNQANNFGTRDQAATNLTSEDIDYIQQVLNGQQIPTNAFSDPSGNRVVFGQDFTITTDSSGRAVVNDQRIDSSANGNDTVDKDADGKVYIDFAKVFSELIQNSNEFSDEAQSTGVDEELKDENNRSINVANATSSNGVVYVDLPFEYLSDQRQITIKGVSSSNDGPTIIINLTDIPTGDAPQTVSSQVHLQYDQSTNNVQDNDLLSKPNHVLWNFGTGNSDSSSTSGTSNATFNIGNSFYGSILAPNATINVTASSFYGNIAANVVNIAGGTSHRWDIQSQAATSQPVFKEEVGTPLYTNDDDPNNLGEVPDGIGVGVGVGTPLYTTSDPNNPGKLSNGIKVYTQERVAAPVYTTSDPNQLGKLSNGVKVYTQERVAAPVYTTSDPNNPGKLSNGIKVYTQERVAAPVYTT
ncbi:collagen-binding domain-containing protein, partial [Secundilactobacillus silagincola]|uniref:collagen-binding domain-containing protein n=1 Tax=Secundilactobacillus silagincola TaxID=1714681 RepID=UPI0015D5189F